MQCQQCGRPLAAADSVCAFCDKELSHPIHLEPATAAGSGRYSCPACHQRFDRWKQTLFPTRVRWYVPQHQSPACPLCSTALRWAPEPPDSLRFHWLWNAVFASCWVLAYNVPAEVRQTVRESSGWWGLMLITLLLMLVAGVTVQWRSPTRPPGKGAGRFEVADLHPSRWQDIALRLAPVAAILVVWWTIPKNAWLTAWFIWLGGLLACCAGTLAWRLRTREQRARVSSEAPTPGAAR